LLGCPGSPRFARLSLRCCLFFLLLLPRPVPLVAMNVLVIAITLLFG
jgi:hypothetical protein